MSTFPRSIWLTIAAIAAAVAVQVVPPIGPAAAHPPPSASADGQLVVDFAGSGSVELTRFNSEGAETSVLVRNDSGEKVSVALTAVLVARTGRTIRKSSAAVPIEPRSVAVLAFSVPLSSPSWRWGVYDDLPARGLILLQANAPGKTTVVKTRDIVIAPRQPSGAELLVTAIGLVAAIGLALYGLAVSGRAAMDVVQGAAWTPQSWSTNLAVGGALLTALLGMTTLPAQTHYAAKTTYTTLSAFFAALVILAPAVYGLLKIDAAPSPSAALRMFSAAAALTVWATVGQLGTAALLFLELADTRLVSIVAAAAATAVAAVVAVLVVIYAARAINSYLHPPGAHGPGPGGGPVPPPAPRPAPAGRVPRLL
jgi:hypothetical protein